MQIQEVYILAVLDTKPLYETLDTFEALMKYFIIKQ